MINNPTWEQIFTADTPYNIQLLIEVSGGTYLTNTEIASESFSLTEMLSDSTQLQFGGCNASQFRLRIRSSVADMTGKTIVVKEYAYESSNKRIVVVGGTPKVYDIATEEYDDLDDSYFLIGTYNVRTDKPTPDKYYRDITAYDAMERIINEDIKQWYDSLFDTYPSVTLKFLREALLDYFEIEYESFTGVNDSVTVGKTISTSAISAKTILSAICELNGCFGYITRDNKFRCKILAPNTVKEYTRYKQGQINYQDAIANVITMITIVNELSSATASVGAEGNKYIINGNVLLSGQDETALTAIATRLLPVIANTAYRPFNCVTYGDPCVELGDFIEIPTADKTVEAYVLYRELSGTQAFRDKLEAKGEEKNASGATGSSALISQLNSNLEVVNKQNELQYYMFRSATAFNIGDGDPQTLIARLRYVNTKETAVNIWHEFKMDVDISEGSDRCKVYVFYYHDDVLVDYQPIETYGLADTHILNLNYALTEQESGQHTWKVYLEAEGGSISIDAGDGAITLHGQGLITSESWDGIIEVSDEYSLTKGGGKVFNYTDNLSFIWHDVEFANLSESFSLTKHSNKTFGTMSDSIDIDVIKNKYNHVSEDKQYRRVSEDGQYGLISEP